MRKIIMTLLTVLFLVGAVSAQNAIDSILLQIGTNNTTLKALQAEAEALKLENKTGLTLTDPEVEFNYLWGTPDQVGTRKDFSVKQNFDAATVFGMKRDVARQKNILIDTDYKAQRMNLLLEAKKICIELIYTNALLEEVGARKQYAEQLMKGYHQRLDNGDANILEYNKVQLGFAMVKGEWQRLNVEKQNLEDELRRLNGGIPVSFNETDYPAELLPADFEEWYAQAEIRNPALEYVRKEIDLNKEQVRLSKAMNLPVLSAGYMREDVVGQHYQGISLGVSIPLWSNKNRVKQAKAAVRAAESRQTDAKTQFYARLANLYAKTAGLQRIVLDYQQTIQESNNANLLKKALQAGEISLLDYMMEMDLYYNSLSQALSAERDYQLALAELAAVEL